MYEIIASENSALVVCPHCDFNLGCSFIPVFDFLKKYRMVLGGNRIETEIGAITKYCICLSSTTMCHGLSGMLFKVKILGNRTHILFGF